LLKLYHTGLEGMVFHRNDEKYLDGSASIAPLSFVPKSKFSFNKKIDKTKIDVILDPGSLLEMKGETQKHCYHRLPSLKTVHRLILNYTFRKIME
jgi:alkylated DNA repair dioxygenase AlkB